MSEGRTLSRRRRTLARGMETEGGPPPQPGCLPISHTGHHHLFGTAGSWGGGQSPVSKGLSLSLCPSVNKCEFVELERVGLSVRGGPAEGVWGAGRRLPGPEPWLRVEGGRAPLQGTRAHEPSKTFMRRARGGRRQATLCPGGLWGPLHALIDRTLPGRSSRPRDTRRGKPLGTG